MIRKLLWKLFKAALWMSGVLVAFIFAAILALLAINRKDDPLQPEVEQALNWQLPANALNDNGFIILLGMDAPEAADPYEAGKSMLQAQVEHYKQQASSRQWPDEWPPCCKMSSFRGSRNFCSYREQNCVEHYLAHRDELTNIVAGNKKYMQRYAAILMAKNFVEVVPPSVDSSMPDWIPLVHAAEVNRALAVMEIADGNKQQGMRRLEQNLRFARGLVASTNLLVGRGVALAMFKKDARILSELVEKHPDLAKEQALAVLLEPISGAEFGMRQVFEGEKLRLLNALRVSPEPQVPSFFSPSTWGTWFYAKTWLPNSTMNLNNAIFEALSGVADASADKQDVAVTQYEQKKSELMGYGIVDFFRFRNPAGKLLVEVAAPEYTDYIERQHDTDGYIRLVALQLKLAADEVPESRIAEVINNSGPEYRNPYTLKPMDWDPTAGVISFTGRQPATINPNKSNQYTIQIR